MFKKTTLKNGLRIITVPMKNTKAVTCLVLVGTGSKYERKEINGISHFLEHMFLKGTKRRPTTLKIAETLDRIGGVYNAFTSKEFTGFWAKVGSSHLDLALDWVSDIFLNSKLESKEIRREKGVIIEEINMYLDTPMRYIEELFEKLLYGDQPAGWLTIGGKENILKFQRKHFLDYLKNHYSSLNTLVCLAGNFDPEKAQEKIKGYFKKIKKTSPKPKIKVIEKQEKPQALPWFKKTDQTHLCLGVRGYTLSHPQKYAQEVLATILGGNMSSRLFILIRERKGLAYYVRTSSELYTDSGYLVTQAGIPHRNAREVINLILREYKNLRQNKIPQKELKKAKDYLKGNLTLSLELSDVQASFYASQELLTGKILTPKEKFAKIDEVTVSDVQKVAKEIFRPEKLNLALIGPHRDKGKFQQLLKL
ncbi:insulinase family protein [Patescibacteria group bacterium]|nr:insulinase family protein [Patescibacteria group bacterium]